MGRKKRKATEEPAVETMPAPPAAALGIPPPPPTTSMQSPAVIGDANNGSATASADDKAKASSGYAMTTHSAEIIDEDIYISDGSEDEEDEIEVELVLVGSRMGIMRRGIHHPMLVQPNRQWVREDAKGGNGDGAEGDEEAEQKRLKEQEEELAKLDPAQRAARLLAEKQKKLEEAKVNARRLESEENAGRDPCLFSKRTAFDIRFDQIDDKPWTRGAGDLTDFFNYGLAEEDWLEYSQQQLMIRQELTDSTRQRRPPDPTIVPVTPRAPSKQTPKVAVAVSSIDAGDGSGDAASGDGTDAVIGPVLVKKEDDASTQKEAGPDKAEENFQDVHVGAGGAWGAGAAPGSLLAKLIEEQERKDEIKSEPLEPNRADDSESRYAPPPPGGQHPNSHYQDAHGDHGVYGGGRNDWKGQEHQDYHGGGHYGQQQQGWNNHNSFRGGRGGGGRGYYGGGGGRGRGGGGRGGFNPDFGGRGRDRPYQDEGPHRGGGGYRKRPRDDYENRRRY